MRLCSIHATGIAIQRRQSNCGTHAFDCYMVCLIDGQMLQKLLPDCTPVCSTMRYKNRRAIEAEMTHCCVESQHKPHARLECSRGRGRGWSAGPPGPPSLQCLGPAWGQAAAFCAPAGLGRHRLAGTQAAPCMHQLTLLPVYVLPVRY